jgi:signal transduction histidine kinase
MMSVNGSLPEIPNKQAETAVYLMVQEALTNVRKHANAQHTWLRVIIQPPLLAIEVEDDGNGMATGNVDAYYSERGRMGVLTMRERVQWLGGKISFTSPYSPEQRGTLVRIEVPLARLTSAPGADAASWVIAMQKDR